MHIVEIGSQPIGATVLDVSVQDPNQKPIALVVAAQLDSSDLDQLHEDYSKVYWASCVTPVMQVLMQLRNIHGGLKAVHVHVLPDAGNHVEHLFMTGQFTAHMDETLMRKALAT
ncbi:MAG: hypothetical protein VX730_06885 [Pseudomonadota bacterium]|nr:hypothetical protein [Pseudomonadota bacterium]